MAHKWTACLVACLAGFLVAGCNTPPPGLVEPVIPGPDVPPSEDILRVGIAPDNPPVIFKRNGAIVGLEADLARLLAEELRREPVFVEIPFPDLITALLDGRIDIIMSGMSITRQRSYRVAFSEPYMRVGQLALVRNEDVRIFDKVGILAGKSVLGVERGSTGALFVERNCRLAKIKEYDNIDQAAQALLARQVDAVIHDAPVIWWLASQYESQGLTFQPQMLTQEYVAWATRPEDNELLEHANSILARWQDNGTLDKNIHALDTTLNQSEKTHDSKKNIGLRRRGSEY